MKRITLVALTTLAAVFSGEAQAAVSDPLKIIYRVAGVVDNGDTATVFLCSNFGASTEKLRFTVLTGAGNIVDEVNVPARKTVVVETSEVDVFTENLLLNTGVVERGGAVIRATSTEKIFCTVLVQDKNESSPDGYPLHLVRFNPATNVEEDSKASGPLKVIYRVPGVSQSSDVITMFHCTNFGNVSENLRFIIHTPGGNVVTNTPVAAGRTRRVATASNEDFADDVLIATGDVLHGSATILGTAPDKIFCSATLMHDADEQGIELQMARVNPAPGTQEDQAKAITDPLKLIYRVSGVVNNALEATVFLCTNFGSSSERVRFTVLTGTGDVTKQIDVAAKETVAVATADTTEFTEDLLLDPGTVERGAAVIRATSTERIFCNAHIHGITDTGMDSFGLHLVRFNPATDVEEDTKASGPLRVIYRVSGVTQGNNLVTMFHCTNFGNVSENLRFVVHGPAGATTTNAAIAAGETRRVATGPTLIFTDDVLILTGDVLYGGAVILATSLDKIFCSATLLDDGDDEEGLNLHMARVNPAPNTQE